MGPGMSRLCKKPHLNRRLLLGLGRRQLQAAALGALDHEAGIERVRSGVDGAGRDGRLAQLALVVDWASDDGHWGHDSTRVYLVSGNLRCGRNPALPFPGPFQRR